MFLPRFSLLLLPAIAFASPRVDISPEAGGRKDVLTPGFANWLVNEGTSSSFTQGPLNFSLRNPEGAVIEGKWWKGGYDSGASFVVDGVSTKQGGGALELRIQGLSTGLHRITTFHNGLEKAPIGTFDISVNGKPVATGVTPSQRCDDDENAGWASFEVEAKAGEALVLLFQPSTKTGSVILNGVEIDEAAPDRIAKKPSPADKGEHAEEATLLTWQPASNAKEHQLYLGSSFEAVQQATPSSPEFRGSGTTNHFQTKGLSHMQTWYWRVDEVAADKSVTQGRVWSFRPRHLAFPEAEGYGRFAIGGRGGRVIEVTNLDDSGPGSLREAVEATGPRTVVFRVGGAIRLKSKLVIRNPYLTIAGQTAPGDGIALYYYTLGGLSTHDVILRYLRIRIGDETGMTMDGCGLGSCDHAIVDHCSIAWSIDEGFSSRGSKNITLQRSLITEALNLSVHSHYVGTGKGHSFAGSISGNIGSFHHNLVANCAGRNWSLAGGLTTGGKFAGRLDIRNNIVFNWAHRTNDGGVKALNLVGNFYIPGTASKVFHLLMPDLGSKEDPQTYFVEGNAMEGYPKYLPNNWVDGAINLQEKELQKTGMSLEEIERLVHLKKPFCQPFVTTQTPEEAYTSVIADVGANFPKSDSIDTRAIQSVIARKTSTRGSKSGIPGIIDSQKDVGGYPKLTGGEAPADTDHDGMPDAWEEAHGLNSKDPADGQKLAADSSGYTNLEIYLNGLVAAKP